MPSKHTAMVATGHPGVFRKGNRYVVTWRHRGRQCKRSFKSLPDAIRFKATADDSAPASNVTLIAYASTWLDSYGGRTSAGLRDSTRKSYSDCINRVVIPYFRQTAPSLRLRDVKPSDIRAFIAHLADGGYKPSTVRRYLAPLKALLAVAYEDGMVATNPASGVRVIVSDGGPLHPKRLSVEQTLALLGEIPKRHADMVALLASTGLRISEALGLLWGDFKHVAGVGPTLTIRQAKTASGVREILLSPEIARRLMTRRAKAEPVNDDQPIFPNTAGKRIDSHNWRARVFKPAAQRAGVPWATPHKLRHGMGSLMAAQGFSAADIARQLGHADPGFSMRTYVHVDQPDVSFIDDALRGE